MSVVLAFSKGGLAGRREPGPSGRPRPSAPPVATVRGWVRPDSPSACAGWLSTLGLLGENVRTPWALFVLCTSRKPVSQAPRTRLAPPVRGVGEVPWTATLHLGIPQSVWVHPGHPCYPTGWRREQGRCSCSPHPQSPHWGRRLVPCRRTDISATEASEHPGAHAFTAGL